MSFVETLICNAMTPQIINSSSKRFLPLLWFGRVGLVRDRHLLIEVEMSDQVISYEVP